MKRNFWRSQLPILLLLTGLIVTAAAWQGKPLQAKQNITDTIPRGNKKIKDIDDALNRLENSKAEVDRSLQEADWQKMQKEIKASMKNVHLDAEKMKLQIDQAMKQVDAAKINAEVQKQLQSVNVAKMQAQVDRAMKQIDAEQIKKEVANALKNVDMEKIRADVNASVSKIDMEKIKAEIDKIKTTDFEKIESDLKKIKPQIEKSMTEARAGIEKAKKELLGYKNFIDGLNKDGLINKKQNYTIEYKKGNLFINGKQQPAEVAKKYSAFLKDRKDFIIKKDQEGFNINNSDTGNK